MTAADLTIDARRGAFARAERGSRRVRRLRVLLPAASLAVALTVAGIGLVNRLSFDLGVAGLALTAEGLRMDAPKLSGSDGKGRTYTVTAAEAAQKFDDPGVIRLFGIAAEIRQADGTWATFSAATGRYDSGAERLRLDDDIRIRTSDGYAAELQKAEIDLKTGAVDSDAPVAFSSKLGAVEAQTMKVDQKSGAVTFGDGVRMTVDPKAVRDQSDAAAKGDIDDGEGEANDATP